MTQTIDEARARLRTLALDTITEEDRIHRRLTHAEHESLTVILDELHRLHVTVSDQRKTLESGQHRKKQAHRKPQAARPRAATTTKTPANMGPIMNLDNKLDAPTHRRKHK